MSGVNHYLFRDPWNFSNLLPFKKKGIYICISGNSGTGKSTLLKSIAKEIYKGDKQTIAVDENVLHHPFLPALFSETKNYGFQIQLNFMVQRSLLVKKWTEVGYNLVMERSHIEDRVFINHFLKMGFVSEEEYDVYIKLWNEIAKRTPYPNIMVFLDIKPRISIKNITRDEDYGIRPKEFPNEKTKKKWLYSWYDFYLELKNELLSTDLNGHNIKIIIVDGTKNIDRILKDIMKEVEAFKLPWQ